jgi:hypothetical protein
MSPRFARHVVAASAIAAASFASQAASLTVSLPDFDGPWVDSGFPFDHGVVGTFNFALPAGSTIMSATFSGTYGTAQQSQSTAGFDVSIEGVTLTVCVPDDPGCWEVGAPFRPFSFALGPAAYPGLLDGIADLRVIQTNGVVVRLGTPTLEIVYAPIPEPGTWALMALGAVGLAGWMRRRAG